MSLRTMDDDSASEVGVPGDIDWEMLDKSKFFFLGAALFSGVSGLLYPMVVMKTRQQVALKDVPCFKMAISILRHEGCRGFYLGFGTSVMGTIPARALYMGALEITKSNVGNVASDHLGLPAASAFAIANATAGLSAAMAAQLVWTPVDVVSQRLMVQGNNCEAISSAVGYQRYSSGIDAFTKIIRSDGVRGLYRGFGLSILAYAPSNAVWWASYSIAHRAIWDGLRCYLSNPESDNGYKPDGKSMLAVQCFSAAVASGASALLTMPLDTVKTRLQVLERGRSEPGRKPGIVQTMRSLVHQGGLSACYRGFGPRWASMTMSATTMITTYEFLKRLSAKNQTCLGLSG